MIDFCPKFRDWGPRLGNPGSATILHTHPTGTSVGSVGYDKPVHSASHCGQWGHFFLACGQTNSVENPWISQSSLDLFPE